MTTRFDHFVIDLEDQLGQGVYGVVYKGENEKTNDPVAAKRVSLKRKEADTFGETTMREIRILGKLDKHPHIIKLLDFHYRNQCFWLIMEFCTSGDLQTYCENNTIDLDLSTKIVLQSASALSFLHKEHVIHRDIKPGNILLQEDHGDMVAKLTDFGLSRMADEGRSNEEWLLSSDVGTYAYKAPEFFCDNRKYSVEIDIFSLGLVLLALVQLVNKSSDKLFPKTVASLSRNTIKPVGSELADADRDSKPLPELVHIKDNDSRKMKEAKNLVKAMCHVKGGERLPLFQVIPTLSRISGYIVEDISGSGNVESDPPEDLGLKFATEAVNERFQRKVKELPDKATKDKAKELFGDMGLDEQLAFVVGIGMKSNEVKPFDTVLVNPDRSTFKANQHGYGGCTPVMDKLLNKRGEVKQKVLHVFKVEFPDNTSFFFHPSNLTTISDEEVTMMTYNARKGAGLPMTNLRKGDIVRIPDNERVIKERNEGRGGWNPQMKSSLGFTGIVRGIRSNGAVNVRCINGEIWIFNPDILEKLDLSDVDIETADLVMVVDDKDTLETLQIGHGGWEPEMETTLGKLGIVNEILPGGCVKVEIGGKKWTFNKKAVGLVAKGAEYMSAITKKP